MLQFPESRAALKASTKTRSGTPIKTAINCPVAMLLAEHNSLVAVYNENDELEHTDKIQRDLATIERRIEKIVTQAADLSPTSFDGAIFQMMLAIGEATSMLYATTDVGREQAHDCFSRLMHRSLDRLAAQFNWPETRHYLCPSYCDPRNRGAK